MLLVHVMTSKTLILLISAGPFHGLIRQSDRGVWVWWGLGTNVSCKAFTVVLRHERSKLQYSVPLPTHSGTLLVAGLCLLDTWH
jgi:hypothetical protein